VQAELRAGHHSGQPDRRARMESGDVTERGMRAVHYTELTPTSAPL
jgi:hypothetical protein